MTLLYTSFKLYNSTSHALLCLFLSLHSSLFTFWITCMYQWNLSTVQYHLYLPSHLFITFIKQLFPKERDFKQGLHAIIPGFQLMLDGMLYNMPTHCQKCCTTLGHAPLKSKLLWFSPTKPTNQYLVVQPAHTLSNISYNPTKLYNKLDNVWPALGPGQTAGQSPQTQARN